MMTRSQAQTVRNKITHTAHAISIYGYRGQYWLSGVDNLTGYPFTVYDYDEWSAQRAALAEQEAWSDAVYAEETRNQ